MADNDSTTTPNNSENQSQESNPDYNKIATPQSSGTNDSTGRDLTMAGGGNVPVPGASMGSANSAGSMNTSDSTIPAGGTRGSNAPGMAAPIEHGKMADLDTAGGTAGNNIDPTAQGNLGGRNPDQPQTAMGDRDPTGNRYDQRIGSDVTDPMTSRDPSKINQNTPEDTL